MFYLHHTNTKQMDTNNVIKLRNDVLQFGMNHRDELHDVLYLETPYKHGTVEIYGCNIFGEIMGVDSDGTEVTVSYFDVGASTWKNFFTDLYQKYCRNSH